MYLDIQKIETLDLQEESGQLSLASMVQEIFISYHPYLQELARQWDTNIRFYMGEQWIYWDEASNTNATLPILQGVNDFIPRPVTNYIAPTIETLCSIYTKNKPTALVFPNTDQAEDRTASSVAEAVLDAKWELDNEQVKLNTAVMTALLCGTVFRKDGFDPTKQTSTTSMIGDESTGDTTVEYLTPMEVYPDIYGNNYIFQASVVSINDIKNIYDQTGNGYTGKANQVKANKSYNTVLSIKERLKTATKTGNNAFASSGSASDDSDTTVLIECYIKPTRAYPNGLMIVVADGIPLFVSESPYYDRRIEDSWHPYSWWKPYEIQYRWHGFSVAERIVPLNRRINGIDSFIQLANISTANPVWLKDKRANVPDGYLNGRPALVVEYTEFAPQRLPGVNLPQSIYAERERLVNDIHFIAGDNQVLHGSRPTGVDTATGLQLLLEQSSTKFGPQYISFEKFLEKGQQKKLVNIAKFYIQDRPDFLQKIKHFARKTNNIDIKTFIGADLRDNLNVRIEAGSSIPRSKLVEQQNLFELQARGLLGDLSPQANPIANQEFLAKFGIKQFAGITNPDLIKAVYVISVLKQIDDNKLPADDYPPLLPFENVQVHMQTLIDEMKKPEFKDKTGIFQQKFQELLQAQEIINQQQMQQQIDPAMQNQDFAQQTETPQIAPDQIDQPLPIDQMPR